MTTAAIDVHEAARPELAHFSPSDQAIAELASSYLPLRVSGPDDRAGVAAVHAARMVVKGKRVAIEKTRVELKADALKYGRQVDGEARRLTALLAPIEAHLDEQEMVVVREQARIAREAEEARQAILRGRVDALQACGAPIDPFALSSLGEMAEPDYQAMLAKARAEAAVREAAVADVARARAEIDERARVEWEALAAARARLDSIALEQVAEAVRLAAERKRIDDANAATARAAEIERHRTEAAELASIETEKRIAREAAQAEADRKAAEVEKAREAAELPYREKLLAVAANVIDLRHAVPEGPHSGEVDGILVDASDRIRAIAKSRRRG